LYFNVKKVNLSESSLDVFQLLLQLSDTMLDLNNQLSAQQNASRLLTSSSLLHSQNHQNQRQNQQQHQHQPDDDEYQDEDYQDEAGGDDCDGEVNSLLTTTTTTTNQQTTRPDGHYDNFSTNKRAVCSPGPNSASQRNHNRHATPSATSSTSIENFINKTVLMSLNRSPSTTNASCGNNGGAIGGISSIINQLNSHSSSISHTASSAANQSKKIQTQASTRLQNRQSQLVSPTPQHTQPIVSTNNEVYILGFIRCLFLKQHETVQPNFFNVNSHQLKKFDHQFI
jgi:hypothetical protein